MRDVACCIACCNGSSEDSIILDFEWFANTSDYDFEPAGQPWYNDFGWNPALFPSPADQLENYRSDSQKSWLGFFGMCKVPSLGAVQGMHMQGR